MEERKACVEENKLARSKVLRSLFPSSFKALEEGRKTMELGGGE